MRVEMTRKQLQTELKTLRAEGRDVQVKLNSKTQVLQDEYDRVMGQPKVERDDIDRMTRVQLQQRLAHLKRYRLVGQRFNCGQKTEILRAKLREVQSGSEYFNWLQEQAAQAKRQEKNDRSFRASAKVYYDALCGCPKALQQVWDEARAWVQEDPDMTLQDAFDNIMAVAPELIKLAGYSLPILDVQTAALGRGYSKSEAMSMATLYKNGTDRQRNAIESRLAA